MQFVLSFFCFYFLIFNFFSVFFSSRHVIKEKKMNAHGLPSLVLFDFDQTAVNMHTGGSILSSEVQKVSNMVTRAFIDTVIYCIDHNVSVGIVSFADLDNFSNHNDHKHRLFGKYMVQAVLIDAFAKIREPSFVTDNIYIVSFYNGDDSLNKHKSAFHQRKNPHIYMVVNAINHNIQPAEVFALQQDSERERRAFHTKMSRLNLPYTGKIPSYSSVLYFDDDIANIIQAKMYFTGIKAIHVDPKTAFTHQHFNKIQ